LYFTVYALIAVSGLFLTIALIVFGHLTDRAVWVWVLYMCMYVCMMYMPMYW